MRLSTELKILIIVLLYGLALLALNACGFLLTGKTDAGQIQQIMDAIDARGCIYFRASATPYASAGTLIVGTWGTPPLLLSECWQALPPWAP